MLRNLIIVAFRNIIRNKFLSIINVLGLATGIASCLAIFLYVRYESNYDRFHQDHERIYRILSHQPNNTFMGTSMFCLTPAPLLPLIKNEVPEIETGCRIGTVGGYVSYDDQIFPERGILLTDSSFFDVFSFKSFTHAPGKVLTDPSKILITNTIAEKHFKDEDPIGKVLRLSIYGKNFDVVVSGILSDPPSNSHFSFDYLVSFELVNQIQGDGETTNWNNFNYYTFVKLKRDVEPGTTESKINNSFINARGEKDIEVRMQALTDIHLHSHYNFEMSGNNDIRQVYLFSSIAVLILFIACFNYINLTTARAAGRFKEIGVRKVLGANKSMLVKQFIFESIVITIISFLISLILIEIFNPTIKTVLRSDIAVYSSGAFLLLFVTSVVLIVGVLSGSYPAFVLAGFKPVDAIKGTVSRSGLPLKISNVLIVLQFVISISLIIGSMVISKQLGYIRNKHLGFDTEKIITINLNDYIEIEKLNTFAAELGRINGVSDVAFSKYSPASISSKWGYTCKQDTSIYDGHAYINRVSSNFIDFYNIKLLSGRNFSEQSGMDSIQSCIVNQKAIKNNNWTNTDNVILDFGDNRKYRIIGVVDDFHFAPLYQQINTLVMVQSSTYRMVSIKLNTNDFSETIGDIENTFTGFFPNERFQYKFLDESLDNSYRKEKVIATTINVFTLLSIIIACLGLYGLAAFLTRQRTHEIGIRKILGASFGQIISLIIKRYLIYIIIATLISWPLTWYFTGRWLENFAFRISVPWEIYVAGSLVTMAVAFITVYYHALSVARSNPVNSIKYE